MKNMRAKGTGRSAATAGTKIPPQFVKAPAGLKPSSPEGFQVLRSGFNRAEEETPDNLCMGITKTIQSTPAKLHVTVTLKVTVTSLLILLTALLFAACGQGAATEGDVLPTSANPVLTRMSELNAAMIAPTLTAQARPTPIKGYAATQFVQLRTAYAQETLAALTRTSTPTLTPTITLTPKPPTPTRTLDPWELEMTATKMEMETKTAPFSIYGDCTNIPYNFLVSPDENWLAVQCWYWVGSSMVVINRDGSKYMDVPVQDIYYNIFPSENDGSNNDLGWVDAQPILWSNDSRYVYLNVYIGSIDVIPDYRLSKMVPIPSYLFYLDLQTRDWARFVTSPVYYYSFSPNGRYLVYVVRKGWNTSAETPSIEMTVCDIRTGKQTKYTFDGYVAAANVVWSEDGTKFAFTADKGPAWDFETGPILNTYIIYMVDPSTQSPTILKEFLDSTSTVYPVEWANGAVTIYSDYFNELTQHDEITIYYLDMNSNQFIDQTPTPAP